MIKTRTRLQTDCKSKLCLINDLTNNHHPNSFDTFSASWLSNQSTLITAAAERKQKKRKKMMVLILCLSKIWKWPDVVSQLHIEWSLSFPADRHRNEAAWWLNEWFFTGALLQTESLNKIYLHVSNLVSWIQSAAACNRLSLLYLAQPIFGG